MIDRSDSPAYQSLYHAILVRRGGIWLWVTIFGYNPNNEGEIQSYSISYIYLSVELGNFSLAIVSQ
jgi:hypothetical protein